MLSELVAFLNSSATGAVLQIVLVRFDNGDLYLADTGFGGQGLLEPVLVKAYDDGGSESHQAGLRYRIRRGLAGSAELLPAAAVDSRPDRDAYIGWYLQVTCHEMPSCGEVRCLILTWHLVWLQFIASLTSFYCMDCPCLMASLLKGTCCSARLANISGSCTAH